MPARCDQEEAPLETGVGSGAKGGTCCKFDQLCSVYLSRLVRACVKLLYLIPWSVSNMAEDDPGQTILPVTRNDLEIALGAANAKNKRTNELLEEHDRQNRAIMSELGSLKQALQKNHPGLSEEAKKARIAPGATFKENGCQKAYNRTLPMVEALEEAGSLAAVLNASQETETTERLVEALQTGEHRSLLISFAFP